MADAVDGVVNDRKGKSGLRGQFEPDWQTADETNERRCQMREIDAQEGQGEIRESGTVL